MCLADSNGVDWGMIDLMETDSSIDLNFIIYKKVILSFIIDWESYILRNDFKLKLLNYKGN